MNKKYTTPVDQDTELGSLIVALPTRYTMYGWNNPGYPVEGRVYRLIDIEETLDDDGEVIESHVLTEYRGKEEWFDSSKFFEYDAPLNAEYKSGGNV